MKYQRDRFGSVTIQGIEVPTREYYERLYCAMRPLVEVLGLAWKPQFLAIKRRYPQVAKVLPFQMGSGRYRRMLGMPLDQLNEWAFAVNMKKVQSSGAFASLTEFRADLGAKAWEESKELIIKTRVMRLGDEYRNFPLSPEEERILEELFQGKAPIHPLTAFLAYGFIRDQAQRSFDRLRWDLRADP